MATEPRAFRPGDAALAALPVIWAAAEASLFFIVADVAIGWIALRRGWRAGVLAGLAAALAAGLGGAGLYAWSAREPARVERLIESLPAVPQGAVAAAAADLQSDDWRDRMLFAAFSGKPYKLYAAAGPRTNISAAELAAATPGARLPRFMLIALGFAVLGGALRGRLTPRTTLGLYVGGWIGFYAAFWALTPG
ncbi:hypothetical protein Q0812_07885 [Brevundimonas sp. 2R-24]|uniref:Uncharacterized protein n=1 Tax=Peiella sedimenti TaxID=3061083 RepID=A0ABT8SLB1_9CAUL|nr:hypothetical protein [Caulobacteraceae bacterium XZ-24]